MEQFLKYLINGLTLGGMYALIALGYTMVYGIIKLINFAHGEVLMVGAFLGYFFLSTLAFNALTPLLLLVPCTLLIGWWAWQQRLPLSHRHTLSTIAVLLVFLGIGLLVPPVGSETVVLLNAERTPAVRITVPSSDLGWRGLQVAATWGDSPISRHLLVKEGGREIGRIENLRHTPQDLALSDGRVLRIEPVGQTLPALGERHLIPRARGFALYAPWGMLLLLPLALASGLRRGKLLGALVLGGGLIGLACIHHLTFALIAAMVYAGLLGVVIERIAYKPLRTAPRIAALITAIGVSLLLQNIGIMIWGERDKSYSDLNPSVGFLIGGQLQPLVLGPVTIGQKELLILIATVLLMLGLQYLVMRTRIGKAMRAVSMDRDAARLMGINVDATISATFAIGSALAAAAGVFWGIYYNTLNPDMGIWPGIKAFVAAVLGGIGSIPGAMVGGLVMGVAENLVMGYLASSYRDAIAFAILIVILLVRPTGLFGSRAGEKV